VAPRREPTWGRCHGCVESLLLRVLASGNPDSEVLRLTRQLAAAEKGKVEMEALLKGSMHAAFEAQQRAEMAQVCCSVP
jgi:hypothetical protein